MTDVSALARELAPAIVRALRDEFRIASLWSIADVARWFNVSERKARDIVATAGFPKPDRLPNDGDGLGHPRWIGAEVIEWWSKRRGG